MSWQGLGYEPVHGASEWALRRQLRTSRKVMLRFFRERGLFGFAADLRAIIKNSSRTGAEKRVSAQRVFDNYALHVTRQTEKSDTETASDETPGAVGVPGA